MAVRIEAAAARIVFFGPRPRSPHFVTNVGMDSAVFLVLQFYGTGVYDFVPLT
jgi:hypothetical protein